MQANVHEAKTQLSKLIDAAVRGEDVVIARYGVPTVRLVPIAPKRPDRRGGWLAGKAKILDPDWEKTDPELERAVRSAPTAAMLSGEVEEYYGSFRVSTVVEYELHP